MWGRIQIIKNYKIILICNGEHNTTNIHLFNTDLKMYFIIILYRWMIVMIFADFSVNFWHRQFNWLPENIMGKIVYSFKVSLFNM